MRVVIHQPCFFPWAGFFSKLAWSEGYIALDDALFRKRHFQDRVSILNMHGGVCWLSIPTGQNFGSKMSEVRLDCLEFLPAMKRTLAYSYARTPFFLSVGPLIFQWLDEIGPQATLAELNIFLIKRCAALIPTTQPVKMWCASELGILGNATERVIGLSKAVGATEILFGNGASLDPAVHDLAAIARHGISIFVQDFDSSGVTYPQVRRQREGFADRLSIIDALFNVGPSEVGTMLCQRSLEPVKVS